MNARIAPPPIWPGPEDVERVHGDGRQAELVVVGVRHVLAGELRDGVGPARLPDRADRRDLALLDVRSAWVPNTSLVEKSTKRSSVASVASAASSAL